MRSSSFFKFFLVTLHAGCHVRGLDTELFGMFAKTPLKGLLIVAAPSVRHLMQLSIECERMQ
jgi:hypothetical protein